MKYKYELKNKELYEKLCALSPDFDKELQWMCRGGLDHSGDVEVVVELAEGIDAVFKIDANEIEWTKTYDPEGWNEWPGTMPPTCVDMRVEYLDPQSSFGRKCKTCAVFLDGKWVDRSSGDEEMHVNFMRFRPWEDEK